MPLVATSRFMRRLPFTITIITLGSIGSRCKTDDSHIVECLLLYRNSKHNHKTWRLPGGNKDPGEESLMHVEQEGSGRGDGAAPIWGHCEGASADQVRPEEHCTGCFVG